MKNKQVPSVVLWVLLGAVAIGAGYFFINQSNFIQLAPAMYVPPKQALVSTTTQKQTATSVTKTPGTSANLPEVTPSKSETITTEVTKNTTVTGIIVSGNEENIVVDYIDVVTGEEYEKEMAASCAKAGVASVDCYNPSGANFFFRNVNPKLRTLKMSANPEILTWTQEPVALSYITAQYPYNYNVTITLDGNGEVIKIEQIFTP